ncbi:MAG: RraA family protein [Lachnospiraceae bacterium]|nr:RraA family protein [Lachnospiraceae bacterium]
MEFTEEIRARFLKVSPAAIGHHISGGFMRADIKPVVDEMKVCGPAYTVHIPERDSSALYYALQKAPKGSVIVIDKGADKTFACVGEFLAEMAKGCGMAGIVIDGPATDKLALKKSSFPVFCTGYSPVTSNVTGTSGEVGVDIECGGAVVKTGDIILGDADGVIVVPDNFMPYLEDAEVKEAGEVEKRKQLKEGLVYNKREDFDVEKFFEFGVNKAINEIKKNKCSY